MPWGLVIFITIVVLSSAVGAISQWLKAQKQLEQERLAQARTAPAARRDRPDSTIDRYVEEVEKLRRRAEGPPRANPPVAAPAADVPVVPVAKRKRVSASGDPTFAPMTGPAARPVPTAVVTRPVPPPAPPAPPPRPTGATPAPRPGAGGVSLFVNESRIADLPVAPVFEATAAPVYHREGGPAAADDKPLGPALAAMLRTPTALPLAVLLQEIFGPRKGGRR